MSLHTQPDLDDLRPQPNMRQRRPNAYSQLFPNSSQPLHRFGAAPAPTGREAVYARDKTGFAQQLIQDIKKNPYKALAYGNQPLDLQDADLSGIDKTDLAFLPHGTDMRGAKMPKDLTGFNFKGANMAGANFAGCNLEDADLRDCNLEGAIMPNANLTHVKTNDKTNMNDVKARGAAMNGAFAGVSMTGIQLQGADLGQGNFTNASMRGTNFEGAHGSPNLNSAQVQEANFSNVRFKHASLAGADATGANFTNAKIEQSNVDNLNLNGAIVTNASLPGTDANYTHGTPAQAPELIPTADKPPALKPHLVAQRPVARDWAGILVSPSFV
jgi:uncharacterized protein YjbI with pentapeptide repeats